MIVIRSFEEADWKTLWPILETVFRRGDTYAFPPEISEVEAHKAWIETPLKVFVAMDSRAAIVGSYYIKSNQPGPGSHVCNCGYIVAEKARGKGVASLMCLHSQQEAQHLGFRYMQYNLVVSTNEAAIRLWRKHGFEIAGRLPNAFDHPRLGLVDALVMYKELLPEDIQSPPTDRGSHPFRLQAIQGLREGDAFTVTRRFTQADTALFGDMTRDYNPVHYDLRWSTGKGFRGLICHGLLVGSMICEFGGQVGWLATGMTFQFVKPVYFGDTIHCTITITEIGEKERAAATAVLINQDGKQVCRAHLTGRLPDAMERRLLQKIIAEGNLTNRLSGLEP